MPLIILLLYFAAVDLVIAARRRRHDSGDTDRPGGRHGEPAREAEQERQAEGVAALALPQEPPGEWWQRSTVARPVPRDGEESQWQQWPCSQDAPVESCLTNVHTSCVQWGIILSFPSFIYQTTVRELAPRP